MKIYLVGGAVRDFVLGIAPQDKDYCIVGATPEHVAGFIERGYEQVGKDFPVFLHPQTKDEYAFARVERKVAPGHQGFTTSTEGVTLEEDLGRRDFTINAMAIDKITGELIDPYNGQQDLKDGVLRHTTHAFVEDPLRIFRAAKFAARYNFTVAPETIELMKQIVKNGELDHLAKERIVAEMLSVLKGVNPARGFELLVEVGALSAFSERLGFLYPIFYRLCNRVLSCRNTEPEDRLGFLMGLIAGVSQEMPPDDVYRKELTKLKLSARTMNVANVYKNFGTLNDFETSSPEEMLLILKRIGFLDEHQAEFNETYRNFCKQFVVAGGSNSPLEVRIDRIFTQGRMYAAALKTIDREAIAIKHGKDGKAIAAEIRQAEIKVINDCNRFAR